MNAPDWAREGRDWPNRAASRFLRAGGVDWHVQVSGPGIGPGAGPPSRSDTGEAPPPGPVVLLLHGTGAATHSWAGLLPLLAPHVTVVAPDLPGHGFSGGPGGRSPDARLLTVPGMAGAVAALLSALRLRPTLVVGHSAGVAVLVRMALDGSIAPARIISLNGALLPLRSMPGIFAPLARVLAGLPLLPRVIAWRADDPALVRRLLRSTGSRLTPAQEAFYARLFRTPRHAAAAIGMMAGWDLDALAQAMPRLRTPLTLVIGEADRTVPPAEQRRVLGVLPGARVVSLPGLGHLAHEEAPERVAPLLLEGFGPG